MASVDLSRPKPFVKDCHYPVGHRDGSNVSSFSEEVEGDPVLVSRLKIAYLQTRKFSSVQTTTKQKGKDGMITLILWGTARRHRKKSFGLVNCQPIPQPHPEPFGSLNSTDTGCQIRIEESVVGCLVSLPSDCSQTEIDGGWRKPSSF